MGQQNRDPDPTESDEGDGFDESSVRPEPQTEEQSGEAGEERSGWWEPEDWLAPHSRR